MSPRRRLAVILTASGIVIASAAIAGVVLLVTRTAQPDADACRAAMKAGYAKALTDRTAQTEPAACKGIPAEQLGKMAMDIAAPSGNVAACRAFADQRQQISAMGTITAADALKVAEWISSDQLLSTGQLAQDFGTLYGTITSSGGNPAIAMSAVQSDCTALGVRT